LLDGKLELKGESKEDVGEAREWISMFRHEAVGRKTPLLTTGATHHAGN